MARTVETMAAGGAMLAAALGTSIANVALPEIATRFGVPVASAQWVVVGYLLSVTVLVAGAGRLGDRYGHRDMLAAGAALFAAAAAAGALASSVGLLVAARVAQGGGAALMMALPVAMLRAAVPADRLGRAMGATGMMSALGTALGPSLGGVLVGLAGWRAVFVMMALAGVVVLALLALAPRRPAAGAIAAGDPAGTVLLGGVVSAWALAMTVGGAAAAGLLVMAAGLLWLFLRVERHVASPMLPGAVWTAPGIRVGLAGNALVATVMMATLVAGPFWLTRVAGLSPAAAGLVLAAGPVLSALAGVPSGWAVDRFGAGTMRSIGLMFMLAGTAGLAVLPDHVGLAGWLASVSALTPGYQMFQAANTVAVMERAPADRRGAMAGILALSRNLGLVTGAALMAALSAAAGMAAAFGLAAVLVGVALALPRPASA